MFFGSNMPYDDSNKIYNQNIIILGFDPARETWGFGYGFQKILYNKVSMQHMEANEKRMINYGVKFIHLNKSLKIDKTFNMISRLNVDYGKRLHGLYWFVGVSINYYLYDSSDIENIYKINSAKIANGKLLTLNTELWPGYEIGLKF